MKSKVVGPSWTSPTKYIVKGRPMVRKELVTILERARRKKTWFATGGPKVWFCPNPQQWTSILKMGQVWIGEISSNPILIDDLFLFPNTRIGPEESFVGLKKRPLPNGD